MIEQLFNVVAPVFVCIGLGWGWAKTGRPYDTPLISALVMNIGVPSLVFSSLSALNMPFHLVGRMGGAALAVIGLSAIVGLALLRVFGLHKRALLPPVMFANIGNMGLPLCLFAFGESGLTLALIVFAVYSVIQFTVGTWLYSGATTPGVLLKMPIIYAVLFSLIVLATGYQPPPWIAKTTGLLGGFTIPLMLMTLGVSLAQLRVANFKRALILSLLRLAVGFFVGLTIAWLLRLPWPARGVLILQSSMPAAVFNYLLAQQYDNHAIDTAGAVVLSTVFALALLPLLLRFLTILN